MAGIKTKGVQKSGIWRPRYSGQVKQFNSDHNCVGYGNFHEADKIHMVIIGSRSHVVSFHSTLHRLLLALSSILLYIHAVPISPNPITNYPLWVI